MALTPPMGWNSWDCYGASINEEQLLGNAKYMAEHLKEFGWEYVVCDIQWYEPEADSTEYHPFVPLCMDEYSRLIPAVNRFPSAANGVGFKKIADEIHKMGLKFGIHLMRGIPRQAVHQDTPIKGTHVTARKIAQSFSVCSWNTDMYGVNPEAEGAQEYYDSLFELYAEWGCDYVKVDDLCITEYKPHDLYSAKGEIEMVRRAIDKSGRPMVLSLSPGPAPINQAEHLRKHANMWRITGDFWDNWPQLYAMFERCEVWSPYVSEGNWPDCDMLPLGRLEVNNNGKSGHNTYFTKPEQITMMTLWSIFRSPLILGAELRELDEWTLSLLTNKEVLRLNKHSRGARQVMRTQDAVVWKSQDEDGSLYVAFFNTSFAQIEVSVSFRQLGMEGEYKAVELWTHQIAKTEKNHLSSELPPHGASLYKITKL